MLFQCMELSILPLDDHIRIPPLRSSTDPETEGDSGMRSGRWNGYSCAGSLLHKQQDGPSAHDWTPMKSDGLGRRVWHGEALCGRIWTPWGILRFLKRITQIKNPFSFLEILSLFWESWEMFGGDGGFQFLGYSLFIGNMWHMVCWVHDNLTPQIFLLLHFFPFSTMISFNTISTPSVPLQLTSLNSAKDLGNKPVEVGHPD